MQGFWHWLAFVPKICNFHIYFSHFMWRSNAFNFLTGDSSCVYINSIENALHLLFCFKISTKKMSMSTSISRSILWNNIVKFRCFVPIIEDIIIRIVLVVKSYKYFSTINITWRRYANCLCRADNCCLDFLYTFENAKSVIFIHSFGFNIIWVPNKFVLFFSKGIWWIC